MVGDRASRLNTQTPGMPFSRFLSRLFTLLALSTGLFLAQASGAEMDRNVSGSKTVLGVRNLDLKHGADALLSGQYEEGVRLTHLGLEQAFGRREEEAALSNLCAGYLKLGKFATALQYCEMLLTRNDKHWRAYNNRALIYILTEQWDKAEADLIKGEEINSGAYTLKVARSMYMDAVHPVVPEVEIDDRNKKAGGEN